MVGGVGLTLHDARYSLPSVSELDHMTMFASALREVVADVRAALAIAPALR